MTPEEKNDRINKEFGCLFVVILILIYFALWGAIGG